VPDAERERPLWQLEQYVSIVFDVVLSGADCARVASWADIRASDQNASPDTQRAIASVFCGIQRMQ
jgi:hypothetical protein